MLAKIPSKSLPLLKKWASLARFVKAPAVKITSEADKVHLSMTSGAKATCSLYSALVLEAEVSDAGSLLTAPGVFFDALGSLQGEEAVLAFDGADLSLSDTTCSFGLNSIKEHENAVEPLTDETATVYWQAELPGSDLKSALAHGSACAGSSNLWAHSSYHNWKTCVHLKAAPAQMEFESCDGYMLAQSRTEARVQGEGDALLPASIAKTVVRLLPDTDVALKKQGSTLAFEGKDILVQVGLHDAKFPDTSKIAAPQKDNAATSVTLSVAALRSVADRIIAFCQGNTHPDNLNLFVSSEGVRATFKNEEVGSFESDLAAVTKGEDLEICLGASFTKGILTEIDSDQVAIYMTAPTTAVRAEPAVEVPKESYVLMPRTAPDVRSRTPGPDAEAVADQ